MAVLATLAFPGRKKRFMYVHESFKHILNEILNKINSLILYQVSNTKDTQTFDSCSRTRVSTLFKCAMNVVRNKAKIMVTKANILIVMPHQECGLFKILHFCYFHSDSTVTSQKVWDRPKTRFDFEKCPEQKKKSWRTPLASSYDRNRLWDVRQSCQPPPFGGLSCCQRWSAGSGPTSSAFFKRTL